MKKILLTLIMFFSIFSYSQNLSIDELVSLRKLNYAHAEEFLSTKGWSYIEGTKDDEYNLMKFAYNKNAYDDSAEAFIICGYSEFYNPTRINISTFSDKKYIQYLARIKALGCKLIDSDVSEGKIVKYYQGKTTTFIVSILSNKDNFESTYTIYRIFLTSNEDYNLHYNREPTVYEVVPEGEYVPVNDSIQRN